MASTCSSSDLPAQPCVQHHHGRRIKVNTKEPSTNLKTLTATTKQTTYWYIRILELNIKNLCQLQSHLFTFIWFVSVFLLPAQAVAALPQYEADARAAYSDSRISVHGVILQPDGQRLHGATVSLQGKTTTTDSQGRYRLQGLLRRNDFLTISCPGYRQELVPVALRVAALIATVNVPPFSLMIDDAESTRFLFGGDTSFARRFLDPPEVTPLDQIPADNPEALIQASIPEPGSKAVVQYIRPYYQNAGYGVLNFESPVTDTPITPHLSKSYKYFSLPGSLPALPWLGVDYVSLGNNHVYDYLQQGMADTLSFINNAGIPHSGAGLNAADAFLAHRIQRGGHNYALLSMTSVTGAHNPPKYVADDLQGGAADLTDDTAVQNAVQREIDAGYLPIVQLHTGKEYTYFPSNYAANRFQLAANAGAALIIAHHPHVAQGIGIENDVITVHCLGNLAFDQDRLDTMLGLLAQVDMRGSLVQRVRLLPVTIKDYRPRPLAGEQALHFLRRIGEYSTGYGLEVFPYLSQIFVERTKQDIALTDRKITLPVTIPASGSALLDLRQFKESNESLYQIHPSQSTLTAKLGRDILLYGDFENHAIDDTEFDAPRWDISGSSSFVSVANAMKGVAGLSSTRKSTNSQVSSIPFRNRIRVTGDVLQTPLKDLSFFGYLKGENAGETVVKITYHASVGGQTFGEEYFTLTQGSHDWQQVEAVLNMPADTTTTLPLENNARAVRLFLRQSPPVSDKATVSYDELALINWEETKTLTTTWTLDPVNQYDFIKISGDPGVHELALTFRSSIPRITSQIPEPKWFPWPVFLAPIINGKH